MDNMDPQVTIIILNWNGWEDTIECLESLYQINYSNYDVLLVDNDSDNDSVEKIKRYCKGEIKTNSEYIEYNHSNKPINIVEYTEKEVENNIVKTHNGLSSNELLLIKNDENYGFAKGNNIGMKFALNNLNQDYILLLNNDTLVKSDFLNKLIKAAEPDNNVGIVSPKILNAYNPKIIDSTGHIFKWGRIMDRGHGKVDNGQYDNDKNIIGAMAAASLYNKKMLLDIGLFDESYVTLYEDAEMSWRAYKNSWKAKFAPESIIYHKRGRSVKKKAVISHMRILSTKNTVKTVERYGTPFQRFLFTFTLILDGVQVLIDKINDKNYTNFSLHINILLKSYLRIILKLLISEK